MKLCLRRTLVLLNRFELWAAIAGGCFLRKELSPQPSAEYCCERTRVRRNKSFIEFPLPGTKNTTANTC